MSAPGERHSSASEEPFHCNLTELATLTKISTNSLRALMRDNADFPIVEKGSTGRDYTFDANAVVAWLEAKRAAERRAATARRQELADKQNELFTSEATDADGQPLTAKERLDVYNAELVELRLRRQKAELIELAELEIALEDMFTQLQGEILALPDRIGRELQLGREARLRLDDMVRAALDNAMVRIKAIGKTEGLLDHAA